MRYSSRMNCGTNAAYRQSVPDKLLTESVLPTLLSLGLIQQKQKLAVSSMPEASLDVALAQAAKVAEAPAACTDG